MEKSKHSKGNGGSEMNQDRRSYFGTNVSEPISVNLIKILKEGNLETLQQTLHSDDCNINEQDEHGNTLLMLVIKDHKLYPNYIEIVKLVLLNESCNINHMNTFGSDALMIACTQSLNDVVELLLQDPRCNPNQENCEGITPLQVACFFASQNKSENNIQIIKQLLQNEHCDPNKRNQAGFSALWVACQHGASSVVELLLGNPKCDPNSRGPHGITPLIACCDGARQELASLSQYTCITKLLLSHDDIDINIRNDYGENAMSHACDFGLLDMAMLLLFDPRLDIHQKDETGRNLLLRCCENAGENPTSDTYIPIVHHLLKHNDYDVNACDDRGVYALQIACFYGLSEIAGLILVHPLCNPFKQSQGGNNALITACSSAPTRPHFMSKFVRITKMILYHTTGDMNIRNDVGRSALSYACRFGLRKIAEVLLKDQRCDPNQQDQHGWTYLQICYSEALKTKSTTSDYFAIFQMLLRRTDIEINLCNKHGVNPFLCAVSDGFREIVQILIKDPRCDPCIRDRFGVTALMDCCFQARNESTFPTYLWMIKAILERDKRCLNMQDTNGLNALMICIMNFTFEIAELLLSQSSLDFCAQDVHGNTCLHHVFLYERKLHLTERMLSMLRKHEKFKECAAKLNKQGFSVLDILLMNPGYFNSDFTACSIGSRLLDILLTDSKLFIKSKRTMALASTFTGLNVCIRLYEAGFDIDSALPEGETIVHCILRKNSVSKFRFLLGKCSYLDKKSVLELKWKDMNIIELAISNECNEFILGELSLHLSLEELKQVIFKIKPKNKTFQEFVQRIPFLWRLFTQREGITCQERKESDVLMYSKTDTKSTIFKHDKIPDNQKSVYIVENCQSLQKKHSDMFSEITSCVMKIAKRIAYEFSNVSELAFLMFEPILSGSNAENSKCFYPDEVDVICKFINVAKFEFDYNSPHSVRIDLHERSDWKQAYDDHTQLNPLLINRAFFEGVRQVLQNDLLEELAIEMPFIQINKHPLHYEHKIPRFEIVYHKAPFLNLKVSVDLAPVIPCLDYAPEKPLPLSAECTEYLALLKVSRLEYKFGNQFMITYSFAEHYIMHNVPDYVRDGYIIAKALRIASICQPGLDPKNFDLSEPIDVQSCISSYILKTCLFNLLQKIERGEKANPDLCPYTWALAILSELAESLGIHWSIPQWYDNERLLISCKHELDDGDDYVCCQKRKLMLALTRQMLSWLKTNMRRLQNGPMWTGNRPITAYKSAALFNVMMDKI